MKDVTPKQKEAREKDCKVTYGRAGVYHNASRTVEGIVPRDRWKELDAERVKNWIPEEVIKGIPQWTKP